MFWTNILVGALLANPIVFATPNSEGHLTVKRDKCPGDQQWNGWSNACGCESDLMYDPKSRKCNYWRYMQKPQCQKKEKAYCASNTKQWCKYDDNCQSCLYDGFNKVFCSSDKDRDSILIQKFPDKHPACQDTQVWDSDTRKCSCRRDQFLRYNRCRYPAMKQPVCKNKERPYCARTNRDWTPWDESKTQCDDNGFNIGFCARPGKERDWTDSHWGNQH